MTLETFLRSFEKLKAKFITKLTEIFSALASAFFEEIIKKKKKHVEENNMKEVIDRQDKELRQTPDE